MSERNPVHDAPRVAPRPNVMTSTMAPHFGETHEAPHEKPPTFEEAIGLSTTKPDAAPPEKEPEKKKPTKKKVAAKATAPAADHPKKKKDPESYDEAAADWNADTPAQREKRRNDCRKDHAQVVEIEQENGYPLRFCAHCMSIIPPEE